MKSLLSLALLVIGTVSWAQQQKVNGRVVTEEGTPIPGVIVLNANNEQLCERSNAKGEFEFEGEIGMPYALKKNGFEPISTSVKESSGTFQYVMIRKIQEFNPIVITRSNSEEALDIFNVNILAYQPLNDAILTLKKTKKTYSIGLDQYGRQGATFELSIDRPRDFFFDCMGNPYILSDDSAYLFSMTDTALTFHSIIPMNTFRSNIMPCVAAFNDNVVLKNYSDFNQTYELKMFTADTSRLIYEFTDVLSYQAAWEAYGVMVASGSSDSPTGDNLTDEQLYQEMRRKRREIYKVNDTGRDFKRAVDRQYQQYERVDATASGRASNPGTSQYQGPQVYGRQVGSSTGATSLSDFMMHSTPIRVETFKIGDFMAVVNFDFDTVSIVDATGVTIVSHPFVCDAIIERTVQDKATGHIYLYTRSNGSHKVYSLNAFTGETRLVKDFGILKHTNDIKIYDSFLYYRVSENGFYQINRVSLPRLEYLN